MIPSRPTLGCVSVRSHLVLLHLRRDAREEVVDAAEVLLALQLLVDAVAGRDGGLALQVVDVVLIHAACRCAHTITYPWLGTDGLNDGPAALSAVREGRRLGAVSRATMMRQVWDPGQVVLP